MGRVTVYRSDVEKARNALLAEGKNPSIDAVRVALGNTGSKTTIHKYLRELETEESAGVGTKVPVSDALSDLVSRLSVRLIEEADARIAQASAAFEAQLAERDQELARRKQEGQQLSDHVQRLEQSLHAEQTAHTATRDALTAATLLRRQLEERIEGLNTRIGEHETHAQSLEAKHTQAREALEHFRTAAKEQRDQEQRRHEHQAQGLQVELRRAQDGLTGKNQELLQLNRDNVRLMEQAGQLTRDLQQTRAEVRQRDRELSDLRPLVAEHQALKERWVADTRAAEQVRTELIAARQDLDRERDSRQRTEANMQATHARLEAIEAMFKKLERSAEPAPAFE